MNSDVKYQPLSQVPPPEKSMDYRSIYSYGPYADMTFYDQKPPKLPQEPMLTMANHSHEREGEDQLQKSIVETAMVLVSYLLIVLTFPFSLLLTIKFVEHFERMVVFRLGRLQKPKGPGAVLVLPCIEQWRRVDLRNKAFNVPPIQAVTADGGVLELGATIFYRIKDAMAAVVTVQDLNLSTRTLAHTALHRHANRKRLADIVHYRKELAAELKEELNKFTFTWGMEISEIEISEAKVLKEGANQAEVVLKTLMRPDVGGQIWQSLSSRFTEAAEPEPDATTPTHHDTAPLIPTSPGAGDLSVCCAEHEVSLDLERMVWTLSNLINESVVSQVGCIYQVNSPGLGSFWMDLKHGSGTVQEGQCPEGVQPDVSFTLAQRDLLELFMGSLAPLDAYLEGKVQVQGDTFKATKLKVLAQHISSQFAKQY